MTLGEQRETAGNRRQPVWPAHVGGSPRQWAHHRATTCGGTATLDDGRAARYDTAADGPLAWRSPVVLSAAIGLARRWPRARAPMRASGPPSSPHRTTPRAGRRKACPVRVVNSTPPTSTVAREVRRVEFTTHQPQGCRLLLWREREPSVSLSVVSRSLYRLGDHTAVELVRVARRFAAADGAHLLRDAVGDAGLSLQRVSGQPPAGTDHEQLTGRSATPGAAEVGPSTRRRVAADRQGLR